MDDDPLRLDQFLCFAVYAAGHALNRVYKPLLEPLGLTYPQYLVMVVLWETNGQTVGQIGARLFLESSTLTPLLKRLEAAGWLHRARDAADERQVRVTVTPAGRGLQERARAVPACVAAAMGQSEAELERLRGDLTNLLATLGRSAG